MKHVQTGLILLLLLSCREALSGQGNAERKIHVKGLYNDGEVYLRWIPADFASWQKGNQFGYKIVRQLVSQNGIPVSNGVRVASTTHFNGPFAPLPEANWEPYADTNDVAAVAAGAIYSEDFEVIPGNGSDELYEAITTNEQNESRFGFGLFAADQAFWVAQKMGLAFVDEQVSFSPGDVFTYQVLLISQDSQLYSGITRIKMGEEPAFAPLSGLTVAASKGIAMLTLPRGDLESHYTSFIIERSADNGATWVQRNDKALLFLSNNENSDNMMFSDTLEADGIEYLYRMRGKSPFGLSGPPSDSRSVVSEPPALGVYPNISNVSEVDGHFVIDWDFPADQNGNIQHFHVLRSANADADFVLLPDGEVSSGERTFTDLSPGPLTNYYKVAAIDNGNHPNESYAKLAQLNDTEAPGAPEDLEATVDNNGLVTLTWSANSEADLKGYRVFFSNMPDDEFTQITTTVLEKTTTTHQLELKMLAKKVYYRILAIDFRENASPYSAVVAVSRPDVMPPAKPVLTRAEPLPAGVRLEWKFSGSSDVARHELQRKASASPEWETLRVYPQAANNDTMTIDSTTKGIADFAYRMVAIDSAGQAASSTILDVRPQKNNLDTIANFKISSALDGAQKQAKLSWEYAHDAPVREFHVYRGLNASQPHFYATLKINPDDLTVDPMTQRAVFIYKDKEIKTGSSYQYRVLAKYPDGSTSPLSKMIPFQY